jgi:hypothetical protein
VLFFALPASPDRFFGSKASSLYLRAHVSSLRVRWSERLEAHTSTELYPLLYQKKQGSAATVRMQSTVQLSMSKAELPDTAGRKYW